MTQAADILQIMWCCTSVNTLAQFM